jgi:hypothetical protein
VLWYDTSTSEDLPVLPPSSGWTWSSKVLVSYYNTTQLFVFWVVTSHSDVLRYQHFVGPCCPEDGRSSRTLVSYHGITTRKTTTWIFSTMKTVSLAASMYVWLVAAHNTDR